MLKVVVGKRDVARAEHLFQKVMNYSSDKRQKIWLGWQGGDSREYVSWSKVLGIWWTTTRVTRRYWNAFGSEAPQWNSKHRHKIDCEINVPFSGFDFAVSGGFAEDEQGKLYLLHRGNIRGGRKGIGKTKFTQNFRGAWVDALEAGYPTRFALIGALDGPRFPRFAVPIDELSEGNIKRVLNEFVGQLSTEDPHPKPQRSSSRRIWT